MRESTVATSNLRKFRTDDDLWERFTTAVENSPDPEADRSKVLRALVRWYAGDTDQLPPRPKARN